MPRIFIVEDDSYGSGVLAILAIGIVLLGLDYLGLLVYWKQILLILVAVLLPIYVLYRFLRWLLWPRQGH